MGLPDAPAGQTGGKVRSHSTVVDGIMHMVLKAPNHVVALDAATVDRSRLYSRISPLARVLRPREIAGWQSPRRHLVHGDH